MVLLKSIKKQFNQFVAPDIEALPESKINLYSKLQTPSPQTTVDEETPIPNVMPQKKVPSHTPPAPSQKEAKKAVPFVESHQQVYSHGLEAIYSLENVDIRTVKTIGSVEESDVDDEDNVLEQYNTPDEPQLDFDLGSEYRSHIESFTLSEPINVLDLSQEALKRLRQQGMCVIRDLVDADWNSLAVSKGMGQGHIDDIKRKLREYTRQKSLNYCKRVDFEAWLRCIIPEGNDAMHYVLLDAYNLSNCISLTPAQSVEVRMFDGEKRKQSVLTSMEEFQSSDRSQFCMASMKKICDAFIKPWLRGRLGFSKDYEIMDRLENVSTNPAKMFDVMRFMQDIFFDGLFPLRPLLPVLGDHTFFADLETLDTYVSVEKKALTYFCHGDTKYTLSELASLVSREFAAKWQGFPEGFVEKVIRSSERFRCRKGDEHTLIVSLA